MTCMTAAEAYAARVDAVNAQRARLHGARSREDRWAERAAYFRRDPLRALDENLEIVASYVEAGDVLLDIGGGAGRVSLPLALRCREVVNVEPSTAMAEQFVASAHEAGIANARVVPEAWMDAEGVEGDVVVVANVTYFVRDMVPFVEKLAAAARRRVMICVWSVPPPAQNAGLFRCVYGEEQVPVPGHRELVDVLWEMGILPDVRVLPSPFLRRDEMAPARTREEAVQLAIDQVEAADPAEAARRVERDFDSLFTTTPDGFRPAWRPDPREILVTWQTAPMA